MTDAVIIEVAINGATTKARNPHVPISEDEIVADAQACFDAGAAIVHHHIAGDRAHGRRCGRGVPRRVAADPPGAPRRAVVPDDQHRPVGPLVRPHHPVGDVRAAADEPQRPRLGQPRRAHGRRAERRLRVRQQLRQHRPPVRPVPRARSRSEHRDLRARVPARRARLPRGRHAARRLLRQALPQRRSRPGRGAVRPAADAPGARRVPGAARGHRARRGRCRRSGPT